MAAPRSHQHLEDNKSSKAHDARRALGESTGPDLGLKPLEQLANIDLHAGDPFLNGLKRVQELISLTPLRLPERGRYRLELEGDVLHVKNTLGIESFELSDEAGTARATVIGVRTANGKTTIALRGNGRSFSIVLHSESSVPISPGATEDPTITSRVSDPWRRSSFLPQESDYGSESRSGRGGGGPSESR